jgi:hypothetical protein
MQQVNELRGIVTHELFDGYFPVGLSQYVLGADAPFYSLLAN